MNFTRINTSGIPEDVLFLINATVIGVIILCAALVVLTNYRDKVKDRSRRENTLRSARADESGAGTGRLSAPIDLEGPKRRNHEGVALEKEQGGELIFPKRGQVWTQKERARFYSLTSSIPLVVFLIIGIVNSYMPMILVAAVGLVGALMIWMGAERDRRGEP